MNARSDTATAIWQAGVDAVGGYASVSAALSDDTTSPDQIIAVGKAAGAMMRAALDHFRDVPALVVTKDGHGDDLPETVRLIEASHPVPDERSLQAGRALRETVSQMPAKSRLLLLVSGGASSLAEDLTDGHDLNDLAALNRRLLAAGLDITAMNVERRKISCIKGGGLLSHFGGASVQVLAISDVPGDDLAVIGSGIGSAPTPCPFGFDARIVASNTHARRAAANAAKAMGIPVLAQEESLHDDLGALVARLTPIIRDMETGAYIFGGEPTVVLPDTPGRGGRNQALALSLAHVISGTNDISIVAGGTDGSDGPTDAAGGIVDGRTWGVGASDALVRADSGSYLAEKCALLTTGPTGTNVMDLLIVLRG